MLTTLEFMLTKYGIALRSEEGQGLIEYVLIGAVIAIAALVGMAALGGVLDTSFTNLSTEATIPGP